MSKIETFVRSELDRRYPIVAGHPDWSDVLERASVIKAEGGQPAKPRPWPRRRGRLLFAFAAATLAAAALSLALVSPWSGGPTLVEQALAAVGSGRYLHLVFESTTSPDSWVDLNTGAAQPIRLRSEWVYDAKTGAYDARNRAGGVIVDGASTTPDPVISRFASSYRSALADDEAHVVGNTTVDGVKATIIRFTIDDQNSTPIAYEDIAVSVAAHRPVLVTYRNLDEHGGPVGAPMIRRVISLSSSNIRPTLPKPTPLPSTTGSATNLRRIEADAAKTALGQVPLWSGPTVGGTTLGSIWLQRVTTEFVGSFRTSSSSPGLRFDYHSRQGTLVVEEAPNAERGYGFWTSAYGTSGPLPPAGRAVLSCDGCRTAHGGRAIWQAQLRVRGLFVTIRSTDRSLVIAAARSLTPLR